MFFFSGILVCSPSLDSCVQHLDALPHDQRQYADLQKMCVCLNGSGVPQSYITKYGVSADQHKNQSLRVSCVSRMSKELA